MKRDFDKPHPEKSTKVHFNNLDVLRVIAALLVVFGHGMEGYLGWLGTPKFMNNLGDNLIYFDNFIANTGLGVNLFFIISGFLITYLLVVEKQQCNNIHVGKFMARRALRIWPLYYIAIAIGFVVVKYFSQHPMPSFTPNLLFYNNFHALQTMSWEFPFAHFWSIAVEEHFYLVWPLICWLFPTRKLAYAAVFLICFSMAFRLFIPSLYNQEHAYYAMYLHTFSRMDEILVGALIAIWHFYKPISIKLSGWLRAAVYALGILLLFTTRHNDYWEMGVWSALFKKYIYLGIAAFWLLNYLFNSQAWFNFKHKNVLHYLGKISFGIYIYHNIFLEIYIQQIVQRFHVYNIGLYLLLYFLFVIAIAVVSFELYERYFLKLKDKFALIKTER